MEDFMSDYFISEKANELYPNGVTNKRSWFSGEHNDSRIKQRLAFIEGARLMRDLMKERFNEQTNLTQCSNCDEMVKMVSSGEFCPKCFC